MTFNRLAASPLVVDGNSSSISATSALVLHQPQYVGTSCDQLVIVVGCVRLQLPPQLGKPFKAPFGSPALPDIWHFVEALWQQPLKSRISLADFVDYVRVQGQMEPASHRGMDDTSSAGASWTRL